MIRLEPGDKVATSTAVRDHIVVITERGVVYIMQYDVQNNFWKVHRQ